MMAPEIAAETMRAYAEETKRLNCERRSNGNAWLAELAKVEKDIRGIIEAIKASMFHESMKGEMTTLENRKAELAALWPTRRRTSQTCCRWPQRSTRRRSQSSHRP
jgi:hypothetical protein|tara:strand:- start:256 stop:573 length:318 start_codon:yes stop_codon:yes gene_type:complete